MGGWDGEGAKLRPPLVVPMGGGSKMPEAQWLLGTTAEVSQDLGRAKVPRVAPLYLISLAAAGIFMGK